MTVAVQIGTFATGGVFARVSVAESITLPNGDPTNPRIDRIICRRDNTTNLVTVVRLAGTPAGSPVAPALTRSGGIYDISLAQIKVLANAVAIAQSDITDERHNYSVCGFSRDPRPIVRLKNNSGGARAAGDVVVIDTTADKSFTTTATVGDAGFIGVCAEDIGSGSIGRIYRAPAVCPVNSLSATRGQFQRTSSTPGSAQTSTTEGGIGVFGQCLENLVNGRVMTALSMPKATVRQVACRVRNSGSEVVTSNVITVLTWDTEDRDDDSMHDNVTNNSRITAQRAGMYQVSGFIRWPANTTGYRELRIFKNGAQVAADGKPPIADGVTGTAHNISSAINLVAGDYIELNVFQNSGSPLTLALGTEGNFEAVLTALL